MGPNIGVMMKQPTYDLGTDDTCSKQENFKLEVINVFKSYAIADVEKMAFIKNWLGRKDLQLLEILTETEQEKCEMSEGLFQTLSNKFKLRYKETIKLLQFCKLARKPDENTEEWMGRLRMSATECN